MKIKNCPNCNSPRIAKILYGMPNYDEKLEKDLREGKIVLGGCCVTENDPDYKCTDCDLLIYRKTGRFELNKDLKE